MGTLTKKILSLLLITVYIGLGFVSIFHIHNGYLPSGAHSFKNESGGRIVTDPFMDSNSNCQLQQFSRTNYLDNSFRNLTSAINDDRALFITPTFTVPPAFEGWSGNLRAPPADS